MPPHQESLAILKLDRECATWCRRFSRRRKSSTRLARLDPRRSKRMEQISAPAERRACSISSRPIACEAARQPGLALLQKQGSPASTCPNTSLQGRRHGIGALTAGCSLLEADRTVSLGEGVRSGALLRGCP